MEKQILMETMIVRQRAVLLQKNMAGYIDINILYDSQDKRE